MSKKTKVYGYVIDECLNRGSVLLTHPRLEAMDVFVIVYQDGSIDTFKYYSQGELEEAEYDETKFAIMINGYPWMAMKERRGKSYKKFKKAVRTATKIAKETLEF